MRERVETSLMTKTIRTTRGKKMQEILAATVKIPEYYGGKRVGPGELPHVQNPGISSPYSEKAKELTLRYLVWLEVRKLETHSLLLVPRWTGFNIKSAIVLWLWRVKLAICLGYYRLSCH